MVTVPHYVRSGLRTATVTNQDEYSTIPQSVICNSSGNLAAPVINCDSATLNSITISWNQGTSNINGYRLYIREQFGVEAAETREFETTSSNFRTWTTDYPLIADTEYLFVMYAKDGVSMSSSGHEVCKTAAAVARNTTYETATQPESGSSTSTSPETPPCYVQMTGDDGEIIYEDCDTFLADFSKNPPTFDYGYGFEHRGE